LAGAYTRFLNGAKSMRTLAQKARDFATEKHSHQTRRHGGAPYTAHLDNVVAILMRHGFRDGVTLAAAYLHDTVKKTDTSVGEIIDKFGTDVARLVYWLTDEQGGNRKAHKLMSAWRLSRAPWEAKIIKLAELIDNTHYVVANDTDAAPAYILEKKQTMWMMADEEGERIMRLPLFREAMRNDPGVESGAERKAG
jgi:(p)ppGpp synthase/HD superfamily hydrolase